MAAVGGGAAPCVVRAGIEAEGFELSARGAELFELLKYRTEESNFSREEVSILPDRVLEITAHNEDSSAPVAETAKTIYMRLAAKAFKFDRSPYDRGPHWGQHLLQNNADIHKKLLLEAEFRVLSTSWQKLPREVAIDLLGYIESDYTSGAIRDHLAPSFVAHLLTIEGGREALIDVLGTDTLPPVNRAVRMLSDRIRRSRCVDFDCLTYRKGGALKVLNALSVENESAFYFFAFAAIEKWVRIVGPDHFEFDTGDFHRLLYEQGRSGDLWGLEEHRLFIRAASRFVDSLREGDKTKIKQISFVNLNNSHLIPNRIIHIGKKHAEMFPNLKEINLDNNASILSFSPEALERLGSITIDLKSGKMCTFPEEHFDKIQTIRIRTSFRKSFRLPLEFDERPLPGYVSLTSKEKIEDYLLPISLPKGSE